MNRPHTPAQEHYAQCVIMTCCRTWEHLWCCSACSCAFLLLAHVHAYKLRNERTWNVGTYVCHKPTYPSDIPAVLIQVLYTVSYTQVLNAEEAISPHILLFRLGGGNNRSDKRMKCVPAIFWHRCTVSQLLNGLQCISGAVLFRPVSSDGHL